MQMAAPAAGQNGDRVVFALINPSDLVLKAKVWCNFAVDGRRVVGDDGFEGKRVWLLFPEQESVTYFDIEPLLSKAGKNIATLRSETTATNRQTQLTMDLVLEFRDELGRTYRPPTRAHCFDFGSATWVPLITTSDPSW
jgi:hypothetical protein